jgi:hypothetical protein
MAKRRRRRPGLQKAGADVFSIVTSVPEASKSVLQQLSQQISAVKRQLEKLISEGRTFGLDLFGKAPGRPRGAGKSRQRGRPVGRKRATRRAKPRRKGPTKAD